MTWPNLFQRAANVLRLRGSLANEPTARILHYLLLGFGSSLTIELFAGLPFWPKKVVSASMIGSMVFFTLAALALLRRGLLRAASWIYLSGIWLVSTIIIVLGGGARSQDTPLYIALSISAVWLLGYRVALAIAGLSAGSVLVMAVLDVSGRPLPHYFTGEPLPNWANFTVALVMGLVPVARVLKILQEAVARSRFAEGALREHQEHLEELVEQRTSELVEARDRAEAANRAKTVFLANMSHELRTPLNAILGFSALVGGDAGLSDEHRRDLAVVGHSGEHLLGLIDDVLDMARIETGGVVAESAPLDLHALVNDAVNMMRERAQAKNLELLVDVSSQTPRFVRSDPGKLRQVLVNLVGNAVKYTDEGSVVVRADAKPRDSSQDQVLILEVADTGIGIAPEDQARIFEPFVQAGGTRTRKGTGLGLGISRRFVELMGGTIQVESTPGRGSRFRVEVPARAMEPAEAMPEAATVREVAGLEPGQPDFRILIVEDQKENWLLLERLLRGAGLQTRVAEDGLQAIEVFKEWRPHFIWMDVRLPVLSGLEATKRIRELEGGQDVKIVAVTASVSASEREEVLAAGLDDFLRKPYRPREIFDCMARHLGVRYVYAAKPKTTTGEVRAVVRPEDMAALPAALREELERAVISLDQEWIGRLVDQVTEQNAALGRVLADLTDAFAYTPILRALQGSKSKLVEAEV